MYKIKLILGFLFVIMIGACKSQPQSVEDFCKKCQGKNLEFIDTIQTVDRIYDLAKNDFESNNIRLFRIGLVDFDDSRELFMTTYGKIKYNINFLHVGDVGSENHKKYNEAMWSFLKAKYGIDQGVFYREHTQKYKQFIEENKLE
jgi:hypothetical protein